ncbi:hypothetical protein MPSEU_000599000 [Mayamaea pseudoterrestris]|nr:hypothetical protein MPSEU_000599000 [Mayamaea pseudoterrestris]
MSSPMDNNDEKIVEDAPRMRSVSMMTASPSSTLIREAPSLVKRYGSVPQELITAKSPPVVQAAPAKVSSLPPSWTVSSLPCVPLYYQLERTHVKISAEPAVVAQRVSDCLRDQSTSAIYHDDQASADVETCDNVSFTVRLWKSQEDNQVIVEVQRTSGCCYLFHQACKAVLRAAMGEPITKQPVTFTLPKCIPQETEAERLACLEESLSICSGLLQNERMDAHLMALETLVKLSKCCRLQGSAARCILSSGDLLHTLVFLIQASSLSSRTEADANRTDAEQEHLVLMNRLAMTVLANCLSVLQEEGKEETKSALQADITSDTTLLALIDRVAHCDKRPHDACQAVRCLQKLVLLKNNNCKQRALALGLANHADFAKQFGDHRHLQLSAESQKLLNQLKD